MTSPPVRRGPVRLPHLGGPGRRAGQYLLSVGETAADIVSSLAVLILVARAYGPPGLGTYSFLLSVYVILSYAAEMGVGKYVERELAGAGGPAGESLLAEARGVVLLAGLLGGLAALALGSWATELESAAGGTGRGFWFLAAALPLNIYNDLQIGVLHGRSMHAAASSLGLARRLVLVLAVAFLSVLGAPPETLTAGFVMSEGWAVLGAARKVRLPSLTRVIRQRGGFSGTLRGGLRYYFTHEALRVLFFVDFFLLGFFVPAAESGAYAEASVLTRLFLLVPLGIAPVFRVRIYGEAAGGRREVMAHCRRAAARVFTAHSVLALLFLLYFPRVLRMVFRVQGDIPLSFQAFGILLPGLLYFSSVTILEPLYGVTGREDLLNRTVLRVVALNAVLNLYLIPYAGILGAAFATSLSLAAYFVLFVRGPGGEAGIPLSSYLLSGGIVYAAYHALKGARMPGPALALLAAAAIPVLFRLVGLYGEEKGGEGVNGGAGPGA
ncbi:MAG: polysaccharide biosynthesis C-terminal domain-containing protein [bacterium]|nr:MAG: polysaccharide biosynthesis C-terminal domain-containing protein [bacterium]